MKTKTKEKQKNEQTTLKIPSHLQRKNLMKTEIAPNSYKN